MIKAIIFDLWETLGTKNVPISKTFFDHFEIPAAKRNLRKYEEAVQLVEWESEQQMAESLLSTFGTKVSQENIVWVCDLFHRGIEQATLFPGMLALLKELQQQYKLALISNTTVFESVVLDKLGIKDCFEVTTFSWQLQHLKPAAQVFTHTLTKLHISPSEAIFVDDGKSNVEAADSFGIQAIQFTDIEDLRQRLLTNK